MDLASYRRIAECHAGAADELVPRLFA